MTGRRVLGIGLDPHTIDFDSDFFRGKPLNADVIAGGIKAEEAHIRAMGHDFEWLLIDARGGAKAASAAARGALAARPVEVVVIGGGVRLDPAQTPVLEALVNAVIEAGPGARVAFNTSPTDMAAAIDRVWGHDPRVRTSIHPGITQEVAPNERQRVPKATTWEALIYEALFVALRL